MFDCQTPLHDCDSLAVLIFYLKNIALCAFPLKNTVFIMAAGGVGGAGEGRAESTHRKCHCRALPSGNVQKYLGGCGGGVSNQMSWVVCWREN